MADLRHLLDSNPVYLARTKGIAYLDLRGCMSLGVTGPILRAAGLPWDLRKSQPYCGYETYEFSVPTEDTCDVYGRYLVRMAEVDESLKIIGQCLDRLTASRPDDDPVMISDAKIGWPAKLALGPDGLGPRQTTSRTSWASPWRRSSTTSSWSPRDSGCRPARPTRRSNRPRRARLPSGQHRRHPAVPGAFPRPLVHQPAGARGDVRGRHGGGRDRRGRQHRPSHGRRGPVSGRSSVPMLAPR